MSRTLLSALLLLPALGAARGADDGLLDAMDDLHFQAPKEKGKAELVEGKVGKAVQFSFDEGARTTFFTSNLHGTPAWDKAAGLSFWVKGDGSDKFGGVEMGYAVRCDFAFPLLQFGHAPKLGPGPNAEPACEGKDSNTGPGRQAVRESYRDAADRVRRATRGKADVLIVTTLPAASRWGATAELSEACRQAAADRKAGLADAEKAFLKEGEDEKERDKLYVRDKTHLSPAGHALMARTILEAVEAAGK